MIYIAINIYQRVRSFTVVSNQRVRSFTVVMILNFRIKNSSQYRKTLTNFKFINEETR